MWGGGGKNLSRSKYSYKTILFGLLISLFVLAMQCSKGGTDEVVPAVVNNVPVTCPTGQNKDASGNCVAITCASGQTPQADGTCKAPDGTITCPLGQSQNASGKCELTCVLPKILQNGVCVTAPVLQITSNSLAIGGLVSSYKTITINTNTNWNITGTIPSWLNISKLNGVAGISSINLTALQSNTTAGVANADRTANLSISGTGAPTQTLTVTQVGRELCSGFDGPTKLIWKYLDKTNPSPTITISTIASFGIVMVKGCKETNTAVEYKAAQNILNQTSFLELQDGITGMKVATLNFTNNSLDSNFIIPSGIEAAITSFKLQKRDGSNTIDGSNRSFSSTFIVGEVVENPFSNCYNSNCFIKVENKVFIKTSGDIKDLPSYTSNFTPSDFNDPTKFDPSIKGEVNRMYTNFANTPGVTWSTIPTWRTVLIP